MKKLKFILILFLVWSCNAQALDIQLNSRGLSLMEIQAARELINQAEGLLPPLLKKRLNKRITIEFQDLEELGHTCA